MTGSALLRTAKESKRESERESEAQRETVGTHSIPEKKEEEKEEEEEVEEKRGLREGEETVLSIAALLLMRHCTAVGMKTDRPR